jgi:hypothetical protein
MMASNGTPGWVFSRADHMFNVPCWHYPTRQASSQLRWVETPTQYGHDTIQKTSLCNQVAKKSENRDAKHKHASPWLRFRRVVQRQKHAYLSLQRVHVIRWNKRDVPVHDARGICSMWLVYGYLHLVLCCPIQPCLCFSTYIPVPGSGSQTTK